MNKEGRNFLTELRREKSMRVVMEGRRLEIGVKRHGQGLNGRPLKQSNKEKAMIKLNERFSFEQDKYQWLLHEVFDGKDRDGNYKARTGTTYHPNLKQVAAKIIDRTSGDCNSMEELIAGFDNAVLSMTAELEG